MNTAPRNYRIFNPEGEHVATVKPEHLEDTLATYNAGRCLDIDGNPVGEYTAEGYDGFVQGQA